MYYERVISDLIAIAFAQVPIGLTLITIEYVFSIFIENFAVVVLNLILLQLAPFFFPLLLGFLILANSFTLLDLFSSAVEKLWFLVSKTS